MFSIERLTDAGDFAAAWIRSAVTTAGAAELRTALRHHPSNSISDPSLRRRFAVEALWVQCILYSLHAAVQRCSRHLDRWRCQRLSNVVLDGVPCKAAFTLRTCTPLHIHSHVGLHSWFYRREMCGPISPRTQSNCSVDSRKYRWKLSLPSGSSCTSLAYSPKSSRRRSTS